MSSLVFQNGNQLSYSINSPPEAKLAIKELKLLKKAFGLKKREVVASAKAVRFRYSQEVKTRGSVMRGGGGLGQFVRAMQTASRDTKRANLARELHPLEMEKGRLEGLCNAADELIIKLELYLHTHS